MAFEMEGSLSCPITCCAPGPRFLRPHSKDRPNWIAYKKGNGFTTSKKCCGEWRVHFKIFNPGPWGGHLLAGCVTPQINFLKVGVCFIFSQNAFILSTLKMKMPQIYKEKNQMVKFLPEYETKLKRTKLRTTCMSFPALFKNGFKSY